MNHVCQVFTVAPFGFEGQLVEVESDLTKGLPGLQVVGLASKAIDEAKERIKSAIGNSLLEYPAKRMTINLAPAEFPKDGTLYDLPMALAILGSSGQLQQHELNDALFAGELALDGRIRPIQGAISIAECARHHNIQTVYVPFENAEQAALVPGVKIIGISSLKQLFLHLKGEAAIIPTTATPIPSVSIDKRPVLDDIYGQEQAKRALIIAAAGHHNVLFSGSPGAGKTMLAKTLAALLPPLAPEESLEVTKLYSLAGISVDTVIIDRPFRAPHHTASQISLIGGGTKPKPGEISLAHRGVLFLDEMPEYGRSVLEALRQPLEDKKVTVTRAQGHATYPADFILIGTMNPCPCGYFGDPAKECTCSSLQIAQYQKRISGPLLDRIDLFIPVSRVANIDLISNKSVNLKQQNEAKKCIQKSYHLQSDRYKNYNKNNGNLSSTDIRSYIPLSRDVQIFLETATSKMNLSARAYFKILKVARTIADLDESAEVAVQHVAEALQYRRLQM